MNTAIRKAPQALHDHIDSPKFVETVPSKAHRIVAEVRRIDAAPQSVSGNRALAVLPFENLGLGGRSFVSTFISHRPTSGKLFPS